MTFKNNFIWDNMAHDWGLELENMLFRSFLDTLLPSEGSAET